MEPDRATRREWTDATTAFVENFVAGLENAPASDLERRPGDFGAPPPEEPGELGDLLARFGDAAGHAVETAGPRYFGYFPAGGLYTSALADLLATIVNRYTGVAGPAPGLVALEHSVVRWCCDLFDLPPGSGGVLTTGASVATLSALHAAREHLLGGPDDRGTIYVTEHTHYCVAKAARVAGFTADAIRGVPVDAQLRIDVSAAAELIRADRARGRRPFFLVGTAGSTSTGTVDPLADLADLAAAEGLWLHADAAYGGGFRLTERGTGVLRGIERADSITFDPHKSLFLPFGTGVLLVRDQHLLRAAHTASGDYLQDFNADVGPDFADLGPELTREYRGLRLWLPLHLHGVAAFRRQLDEKLDLSEYAHAVLAADENLVVPLPRDLTVSVFHSPDGDAATELLAKRINATQRIYLSSTRVAGRFTIRFVVLSHRTHRPHVEEALDVIRAAARP
jgi:aromatic-L-amino-acid decarboxylase